MLPDEESEEEREDLFLDTGTRASNKERESRKEREEKLRNMFDDDDGLFHYRPKRYSFMLTSPFSRRGNGGCTSATAGRIHARRHRYADRRAERTGANPGRKPSCLKPSSERQTPSDEEEVYKRRRRVSRYVHFKIYTRMELLGAEYHETNANGTTFYSIQSQRKNPCGSRSRRTRPQPLQHRRRNQLRQVQASRPRELEKAKGASCRSLAKSDVRSTEYRV